MNVRKLRIAQIAPMTESVPPKKYGGTERVVSALTEELVRLGHEVTLFASGDSKTSAKLEAVYPRSVRNLRLKDIYGQNYWTMLNIGVAYERQDEFDIIHDHNGYHSLPTANIARTPVVMTLHGAFDPINRKFFPRLSRRVQFIGISKAQIKTLPQLKWREVVYNGLPMNDFPFSETNERYLLFVGRLTMEKGPHLAIEVAQALNLPLIIAAKLDFINMNYYEEYIEPRLSDDIRWIGEVDQNKRNELMSKALCLLHPVTWQEPFGLTLIEAMACGCPVVAINAGSIPEVVKDKKTGFVVDDVDEMVEAVDKISSIDRNYCRSYSLKKFNVKKMASKYVRIYNDVCQN